MHTRISSGATWENVVGYSRAVIAGNMIFISGTVAVDDNGALVGKDDAYEQTKFILQKVEKVLLQCGASLEHVVRTRLFVTDIEQWESIGKAHREVFGQIKPCTSMLEISRLIHPDYLIEIEVDAVLSS